MLPHQHPEYQYLALLRKILHTGVTRPDRTGIGTRSVFGYQMRFDLAEGFPLLTTKRLHWRSIVTELLWMLKGRTDVRWLNDRGCTIWDDWQDESGELGPVYGKQWRSWELRGGGELDQIKAVQKSLRTDPNSRRHVVTAWNPADLDDMALAPCHCLFQFYIADGRLSLSLYQRSADVFLGLPFNIASYALLTMLMAQVVDLKPGDLVHTIGDAHLYLNHQDQALRQLGRTPHPFPRLEFLHFFPRANVWDYKQDDFALVGYHPHDHIAAPVAV